MEKLTLEVTGMHCASCGLLIDETLQDLPGVESAATDVEAGRTVVEHDPGLTPPEAMAEAIAELGYQVQPAAT